MSCIFSKLSMKDLVKTSTLFKQWIHEWGSRKNLNFDIHDMFGSDIFHLEEESSPIFELVRSELVVMLNQ